MGWERKRGALTQLNSLLLGKLTEQQIEDAMYITHRDSYREIIDNMRKNLENTLPQICAYFNMSDFNDILDELEKFDSEVENHYMEFEKAKQIWKAIIESLREE